MHLDVVKEADGLLAQSLETPGLRAAWTGGLERVRRELARLQVPADAVRKIDALMADGASLAARPASAWEPELLRAWQLGLVHLLDDAARVSPAAELAAIRLVIRGAIIAPSACIVGERVLLQESLVDRGAIVEGPIALVKTRLAPYVVVGPYVLLVESTVAHFAKVQRFVRMEHSMLGSNSCIEGGTHPEKMPLGPLHRALGVTIARDCWIGQQVSITAGASLGPGVVVAPHTAITGPVPELVVVAGAPPRQLPIDANLRTLTAEEAREEGRLQGTLAMALPAFGPWLGGFADERTLELDYAQHACVRGLASENLLHFQRGVLEVLFAQLFPDHTVEIAFRAGRSVRFTARFDRPPPETPVFRRGHDAGMIVPEPGPALLEAQWQALLRGSPGRLLRFEEAPPPTAAAPAPAASAGTLAAVVDLLRELLASEQELDADLPFHRLGVDSLALAELAARVEQHFQLDRLDVYVHRTLRQLAAGVDAQKKRP
jgi:acetyltransferase-like isoleucine patch superfamily enzyme/acyl carrier protein